MKTEPMGPRGSKYLHLPGFLVLATVALALVFLGFSSSLHNNTLIRQTRDNLDHSRQIIDRAGRGIADLDTMDTGNAEQAAIILGITDFVKFHPDLAGTRTFREAMNEGSSISTLSGTKGPDLYYRYFASLPGTGRIMFLQDRLSQAASIQETSFFWTLSISVLLLGLAFLALGMQQARWTHGLLRLSGWLGESRVPSPSLPVHKLCLPEGLADFGRKLEVSRRQMEQNQHVLEERNQELVMLLEAMDEGFMVLDKGLIVHRLNQFMAGLFELDPDLSIHSGKHFHELVRSDRLMQILDQCLAGEECPPEEIKVYKPRPMQLKVSVRTLESRTAEDKRLLVLFNDLSGIRRLEEVRKDFVANVSHELRTPITAIRGFAETMLEEADRLPEDFARFTHIIHRQSLRLEAIIHDLLSLSRLEQTGQGITREHVLSREILEAAMEVCLPQARKKRTIIELADGNIGIDCNRALVEQALINLVNNAVLYCPEDSLIKVTVEICGDHVAFTVSDNGPGIPARDQERLFERFYRVEKARTRDSGGTGLGLAIVRHIAQAHGGTVELESVLGTGASFRILIPSRQEPETGPA